MRDRHLPYKNETIWVDFRHEILITTAKCNPLTFFGFLLSHNIPNFPHINGREIYYISKLKGSLKRNNNWRGMKSAAIRIEKYIQNDFSVIIFWQVQKTNHVPFWFLSFFLFSISFLCISSLLLIQLTCCLIFHKWIAPNNLSSVFIFHVYERFSICIHVCDYQYSILKLHPFILFDDDDGGVCAVRCVSAKKSKKKKLHFDTIYA